MKNSIHCINTAFYKILKFFEKFNSIEPNSIKKLFWDFYIMLCFIFSFSKIPMFLSFEINIKYNSIDIILILSFILNIFFEINTAFYSKGNLIRNKNKILKNYINTNLTLDLTTTLPLIISFFIDIKVIQLFFLLKFLKLFKLIKTLDEYLQLSYSSQAVFDLIKLSFFMLYLAHISCCAFHFIARYQIKNDLSNNTWLHEKKLINSDWIDKYITSLYFSIVTMTTVGYGDISPVNNFEKVFCTFFMLISCVSYGYIINSIGQILNDMSKNDIVIK